MAKREPIDVICQHSQDGTIVPLKIRVRDDDGEYQAYMIQGFRRQDVVKGSGEYGLPAHGCADCEVAFRIRLTSAGSGFTITRRAGSGRCVGERGC